MDAALTIVGAGPAGLALARVRPGLAAFTDTGARFADGSAGDFDVIVLCTGYRPALDVVGAYVRWDEDQRPLTQGRSQQAPGSPGLHLIGDRHLTLETFLRQLRREAQRWARAIVREIKRERAAGDGVVTGTTVTAGARADVAGLTRRRCRASLPRA